MVAVTAPIPRSVILEALEREESKRACERSLHEFVRQAWHVVEPGVPFIDGWFIGVICEHLEAITAGEIRKLLINIPPRHSKSTIVSVMFNAWEWGPANRPQEQYLCASYSSILSTRDNLKTRRLLQSKWYRDRWGDRFSFTGDQNQKTRFENDKTGYRIAGSVGGTTTGEGGSRLICLHPSSLIQCKDGLRKISELIAGQHQVLGFDHATGMPSWQRIVKVERSRGRSCKSISTTRGTSLVETTDHPVFVIGRGYIQACEVVHGDCVLRYLPKADSAEAKSHCEAQNTYLQHGVQEGGFAQNGKHNNMPCMWNKYQTTAGACSKNERSHLLQPQMPRCLDETESHENGTWRCLCSVHSLWQSSIKSVMEKTKRRLLFKELPIRGIQENAATNFSMGNKEVPGLFERVFWPSRWNEAARNVWKDLWRHSTRQADDRFRKWSLCAWQLLGSVPSRISPCIGLYSSSGWQSVSLVWNVASGSSDKTSRSSYRLRQEEQPVAQPDYAMPLLPRNDAWQSEVKGDLVYDIVCSIDDAETPEYVFNIEVENTHNYFANGLLVHNCDDPISATDAFSDAMRGSTNEWIGQAWSTRLNNPKTSAMITIMQRLHDNDPTGLALKEQGWQHVCLPAEYDGIPRKTILGAYDPRIDKGSLLCPERFGEKEIAILKRALGEYGVSGQLQQNPSPVGGGILKVRDHIQLWPRDVPLPMMQFVVQSYDTAFTESTQGCPTAHTAWGVFEFQKQRCVVLLDAWAEHLGYPELRTRALRDWHATYGGTKGDVLLKPRKPDVVLIEQKGSGQSLIQDLRAAHVPVAVWPPKGQVMPDKIARAHQAAPILEIDVIFVIETSRPYTAHEVEMDWKKCYIGWAHAFLEQLERFPAVDLKDYVDTFTQAMIYLRDNGQLTLPEADPEDDPEDRDYDMKRKSRLNPYAQ